MTGNPVECVIHPDLWNKSELWDPLGIGRVSLDPVTERNLDDEYVEENYGSPINTVSQRKLILLPGERNILRPLRVIITLCLCIMYYIHLMNRENIFLAMLHVIFSLMKPQQHRIFLIHLDFRPIKRYHQELVRILDLKDFI